MPLQQLVHNTAKRATALADLDEICRAIFDDAGGDLDVYVNYDRLCKLRDKMRRAIDVLRQS